MKRILYIMVGLMLASVVLSLAWTICPLPMYMPTCPTL